MEKTKHHPKQLVLEAVAQLHKPPHGRAGVCPGCKGTPHHQQSHGVPQPCQPFRGRPPAPFAHPPGRTGSTTGWTGTPILSARCAAGWTMWNFLPAHRAARLPRWIPLPNRPPATQAQHTVLFTGVCPACAAHTAARKREFYAEMRKIGCWGLRAGRLPAVSSGAGSLFYKKRRRDGLWI